VTDATWIQRTPWLLVGTATLLCLLGLTAIARGDELYQLGQFAPRQQIWAVLGAGTLIAGASLRVERLKALAGPLFALSIVLLIAVFFTRARNNSHRWIPLGLMDFQPSELAKLAFITMLGKHLSRGHSFRHWTGLLIPFALMLLPCVLILREPDLGTSLLFVPVLFAMLFAAGARLRHLLIVCLLGTLSSPLLWLQMSAEQKSRIVSVFTQRDSGEAPDDDGYHLHQAKRVLARGGVFGSELAGVPFENRRAFRLPESRTDFVFCLIGERWGLIGCLTTLLLYAALTGRGLLIASGTRDPFNRLLVVGVVTLLGSQMVINTAMTVGLLPITGMTLPLVSYGGSSLLMTSFSLGLCIGVALQSETTDPGEEPFRFLS